MYGQSYCSDCALRPTCELQDPDAVIGMYGFWSTYCDSYSPILEEYDSGDVHVQVYQINVSKEE